MSATDELRRILNERGVEWESGLPTETIVREPNDALYVERPDGRMHVYFRSYLTPEQAIAATLGPCNDSCNCTNGERTDLAAENAKLRELVVALYHIHFGTEEESWDAWEDFCPCDICEERHGGEVPCAHTAKDMADECCDPITKEIVIGRMRELGVDDG